MNTIDYLDSIKPCLSSYSWINAFIFGSYLEDRKSADVDVCLILDHNETSIVANIQKLVNLFEILWSGKRDFAVTPTFELASFALPKLGLVQK